MGLDDVKETKWHSFRLSLCLTSTGHLRFRSGLPPATFEHAKPLLSAEVQQLCDYDVSSRPPSLLSNRFGIVVTFHFGGTLALADSDFHNIRTTNSLVCIL
jgi:hypothetical protein